MLLLFLPGLFFLPGLLFLSGCVLSDGGRMPERNAFNLVDRLQLVAFSVTRAGRKTGSIFTLPRLHSPPHRQRPALKSPTWTTTLHSGQATSL